MMNKNQKIENQQKVGFLEIIQILKNTQFLYKNVINLRQKVYLQRYDNL